MSNRRRHRALASVVLLGSLALGMAVTSAPVVADCATIPQLTGPAGARGTTFIGVVEAYRDGRDVSQVTWRVERVYAGSPVPERLTLTTPGACTSVLVEPGVRYLFTTSRIAMPSTEDSLAWVVGPDGLSLWGFGNPPIIYPRPTRGIDTLAEALDAVAPDTRGPLPPTDAGLADPPRVGGGQAPFLALVGGVALAIGLARMGGRTRLTRVTTPGSPFGRARGER